MSGGRRPASGVWDNLPNIIDLPPRDPPQINVTMPEPAIEPRHRGSVTMWEPSRGHGYATRRSNPVASHEVDIEHPAPGVNRNVVDATPARDSGVVADHTLLRAVT
jgi:hypothetical protein